MKVSEMRAMSIPEAKKQLTELRSELAKERAVAAGGTRPENPGKIRGLRKTISRILTIVNEKKRKGEKETPTETKKEAEKKPVEKETAKIKKEKEESKKQKTKKKAKKEKKSVVKKKTTKKKTAVKKDKKKKSKKKEVKRA